MREAADGDGGGGEEGVEETLRGAGAGEAGDEVESHCWLFWYVVLEMFGASVQGERWLGRVSMCWVVVSWRDVCTEVDDGKTGCLGLLYRATPQNLEPDSFAHLR